MAMQLNDVEQRVLGVIIEKALTQQSSYPLTLNAIQLGANQKQNRDPVVDYSETQISQAVHSLQRKQLVKQAPPVPGARANRFEHNLVERLKWDRREQAVMAELMLRGRQTVGELRGRASRMTPLPDIPAVQNILDSLAAHDPPFVRQLDREPGRSAVRFEHLLAAEVAAHQVESAPASSAAPAVVAGTQTGVTQAHPSDSPEREAVAGEVTIDALAANLAALEVRVAELERHYARNL